MANEKHVMYVGGAWGDAIYFWDLEKTRIYGFKPYRFAEGSILFDLAHHVDKQYVPMYLVKNMEWQIDPSDMFFADIELICVVRNPMLDKYPNDWFVNPCIEAKDVFQNKYEQTKKLSLKKKRELKRIIKLLKELTKR